MSKDLAIAAFEVKDELEKDPRIIILNRIEKEMEQNEEVMLLSYHFSLAQTEYNDTLRHYGTDSVEAREAQRKLFLAKKVLDEHPLVARYLKAFGEVRRLYEAIDKDLFDPFMKHRCEKK